ncbi:MAG: class 1 fructose-bisphosphatase [Nitrospinota bacterium]|nr:class 1 fructose-bisphosphatase [Nitrospinota bacterium]
MQTPNTEFVRLEKHLSSCGLEEEVAQILCEIAKSSKIINSKILKAGLIDILGTTGGKNVQGEVVQKLDEFANNVLKDNFEKKKLVAGIASEEMDNFQSITETRNYLLLFDPLDGSSNIDVNVSIGTIFSILKRDSSEKPVSLQDFLQPGINQISSGYVIYGSSTMFVYTAGKGVHGFTLDPSEDDFFLSHPDISIPEKGKTFSINEGNSVNWLDGVSRYISHLKINDSAKGTPYSGRYIGSLVADFHRNLLKGGIFLYPNDKKNPNGKLRLLYECNPMSFIVEQAGGASSNGSKRILEIIPEDLHERTSFLIGSKQDVQEATKFQNN